MNPLPFPAIPHHPPTRPGSKSPIEVSGAEGPRVSAPIKVAERTDPSRRRCPAPLAVALQPLPSARGRVRTWPSVSPTYGRSSGSGSHFSSYRWQH